MTVLLFLIFFAACCAAAATGSMFPPDDWYDALDKPGWTPPNWLFPIAWTLLYIAMAYAGARLAQLPENGVAMGLWALQIALNTLWTPVFFGLKKIKGAMIAIATLWGAVVLSTLVFFSMDPISGWLFVPYALWVSYAAALNFDILRRNPAIA
ncbi:MAG: TspO/MBR family protein [Pseudomonadota bacterium]